MLHEHAASLSAAGHANRSRRLNECAKVVDATIYLCFREKLAGMRRKFCLKPWAAD
jgi:hypothetical protein